MTSWWWFMSWIFKSRCQIESLVTGQTHESCSLFVSKLICNITLLMITHFLHFQVQISNWTLFSQWKCMNPVSSLIQNYFDVWLCNDNWICTFKSRCQIELLITGHTHESCLLSDSKLLCQMTFVVILHFLQFQVQMSNWTSCLRAHTWILFPLWFKTARQNDFCVDISFPSISSPDVKLNFLSQGTHMNPVRSLI